jgi:hypothetical protein
VGVAVLIRLIMDNLLLADWRVNAVSGLLAFAGLGLLGLLPAGVRAGLESLGLLSLIHLLLELSDSLTRKLPLIH